MNGEKTFITNGCHADLFVVLARASGQDGQDAGITACVLERSRHQHGITSSPLHSKMGMCRTDTATVKFENVLIDDGSILGPVGGAGQVARRVLLRGRIGVAALVLGLARDCYERAASYTKTRMIGKTSLYDQQLTQFKLSQMEENLWVAWQAVRSAAQFADQSEPCKVRASMAKVFATETALRISDEAIQLLGGYGYMADYKVEQNYRDARLLTIGEGASEILWLAIARNLDAPMVSEMLVPWGERLENTGELACGSLPPLWGPAFEALKLARSSFQIALERIREDGSAGDLSSLCQSSAVRIADMATRLWIAGEVTRAVVRLNFANASEKPPCRGKAFLVDTSLELCHGATALLRAHGLTDDRLLSNYSAVVHIAARDRFLKSAPPLVAEFS